MQIDKKKLLLKNLPSMRQMLAFIAVYEYGHMSAAAEDLALTQPAVTVLIRELEAKLGVKLFDRATRTLKPTSAAELVLPYIMRALSELDELNSEMKNYAELNQGTLKLALTPNSSQNVLPSLLIRFKALYPDIALKIIECEPLQLIPTLLKDQADLGLGVLDKSLPNLCKYKVLEEEIVAVCQSGQSSFPAELTWEILCTHPLILTNVGYGIRTSIDEIIEQLSLTSKVNIAHEASLISTVIALAKSGLGIGIVPHSALDPASHGLDIHQISEPTIKREISIIHLKDKNLSPSAQAFISLLSP